MPDSYANDDLLEIAEAYDADIEPGAYIPRKDENGDIENWLNELHAASDGEELHISGLARDREKRLGWILGEKADGLDAIAAAGFLDDLEEAGYDGSSFDDPEELQAYIQETAAYGGVGTDFYSVVEDEVIEQDAGLEEATRTYLDQAGYTGIAIEGTPEHAVEQSLELLQLSQEKRQELHDGRYNITVEADGTVADR